MSLFSSSNDSGLTVVEMIVVVAIIGIVLSISVFSFQEYVRFSESKRSINSVVFSVKEIQVWATASRDFPTGSGEFDSGFGIYFKKGESKYTVFGDSNQNNQYNDNDNAGDGELLEDRIIEARGTISDICVSVSDCGYNTATVVYRRPSLGPSLSVSKGSSTKFVENVYISVKSPSGRIEVLKISSSGEITSL